MFKPRSLEESKAMVVGDCNGIPTARRWEVETPIFGDIILKLLSIDSNQSAMKILDFGCGSGRLAKYILEKNRKIKIIGVDNSPEMLLIAKNYVLSDRFETMRLEDFLGGDLSFPLGYCVYVLQHVPAIELREIINKIAKSCRKIMVINSVARMAVQGNVFVNDGVNVLNELARVCDHFEAVLPWDVIIGEPVIRTMFLEGQTLHYALTCQQGKKE